MESVSPTLPELLKSYLDDVMETTSFEGVSPQQREAFEKSVEDRVSDEVMKIVIEHLSDEEFQTFISVIDGGSLSPEEEVRVVAQAIEQVPDFSDKIVSALIALRPKLTVPLTNTITPPSL